MAFVYADKVAADEHLHNQREPRLRYRGIREPQGDKSCATGELESLKEIKTALRKKERITSTNYEGKKSYRNSNF